MEHRALTLAELSPSIAGAFASMAEHIDGASIERGTWGLHCQAPLRHPLANFAWVDDVEAWQSLDLPIQLGNCFNVYVPSTDEEPRDVSGFRHALSQNTMTAEAKRRPLSARHFVEECKLKDERLKAADFMVSLFYSSSSREVRSAMTRSLCFAEGLRLFRISDGRGGTAAACALYVRDEVWGIYNVIVDEDRRRAGRGQALIEEMLAISNDARRLTQLQCHPNLVSWYQAFGFRAHSYLHIFCI